MADITPDSLMNEAGRLFAYAVQRVGNHHHAEDLVQECLVTAWRKREVFAAESSLGTWLVGILKFKILEHHRRVGRTPTDQASGDAEVEGETEGFNPLDRLFHRSGAWKVDPSYGLEALHESPESGHHRAEILEWVRRCLRHLPERLRLLFTLREMDELSVPEAAEAAGVTAGSAAVLLTRARHQLRACLQQHDVTP